MAAPGECTPCAIQGCASCDDNYKQCAACSPAYGATKMINLTDAYGNLQPESCAPCPSGCGACSLDATVCVAEITNCPATTPKAATAAKKNAWDKTGYCTNPPGVTGNGYVSTFTGEVPAMDVVVVKKYFWTVLVAVAVLHRLRISFFGSPRGAPCRPGRERRVHQLQRLHPE